MEQEKWNRRFGLEKKKKKKNFQDKAGWIKTKTNLKPENSARLEPNPNIHLTYPKRILAPFSTPYLIPQEKLKPHLGGENGMEWK